MIMREGLLSIDLSLILRGLLVDVCIVLMVFEFMGLFFIMVIILVYLSGVVIRCLSLGKCVE